MKNFNTASTMECSTLLVALFAALLIVMAAVVRCFEQRRYPWLRVVNGAFFVLLFILLAALVTEFSAAGSSLLSNLVQRLPMSALWGIAAFAAFTCAGELALLSTQIEKRLGRESVKRAIDSLPSAVCWFRAEGSVKLCNLQMYRLFNVLAGRDLQNLFELQTALENCPKEQTKDASTGVVQLSAERQTYLFPDGSAWRYSRREIKAEDEETYIEAVFSNVTGLYEKNLELKRQTEQLKAISYELKKLSEHVLELTRESEILAAKTRLHDRIGAGLIAIRRTLLGTNTAEEGAKALKAFANAVRMLRFDNESASGKGELAELMRDADAIGTRIELSGELPQKTELRKVFLIAMRECLTNSVRHADATVLNADIRRRNGNVQIKITNNGRPPERSVVPKGGLLNLSRYVSDCGGRMRIESFPQFALLVELPETAD